MTKRACFAASLGLALVLGACSKTPTLPLPPPNALVEPPDASGTVTVGLTQAEPAAMVFVYNTRTERGVIELADAQGRATVQIAAQSGDRLRVWQRVDGEAGRTADAIVPGGPDAGGVDAGPSSDGGS